MIEAAVKAIEAVDECVGKAYEALKEADGQCSSVRITVMQST